MKMTKETKKTNESAETTQVSALDYLMTTVDKSVKEGIKVPDGYDEKSAVQSAYLKLLEIKDKNGKGVFEVCTQVSIASAIRAMVIFGLHPDKVQGYFIVRGNQLTFMPSYFGMQMMMKRDAGIKDVFAQVILNGDELETEIRHGEEYVVEGTHKRKRVWNGEPTMTRDNIVGAYAITIDHEGNQKHEIMDKLQLNKAWDKSSSTNQGVHNDFPEMMAKRTVINRLAKRILNTSTDDQQQQLAQALASQLTYDDEEEIYTPPQVAYKVGVSPDDDAIEEGQFKDIEPVDSVDEIPKELHQSGPVDLTEKVQKKEAQREPEQIKAPFAD